jgi:hypothetical protein
MRSTFGSRFLAVVCLAGEAVGAGGVAVPLQRAVVQVVACGSGADVQEGSPGRSSLNLGRVSMARGRQAWGSGQRTDKSSFSVATQIGLRVDCGSGNAGRLATLSASLAQPDARYTVKLDGMRLSAAPEVIGASVACRSTTEHSFELEVRATAPAGAISPSIRFEATLR